MNYHAIRKIGGRRLKIVGTTRAKTTNDLARQGRFSSNSWTDIIRRGNFVLNIDSDEGAIAFARSESRVVVGDLAILPLSRKHWARLMVSVCRSQHRTDHTLPFVVFSANGQVIALNARDAQFRSILAKADAIDADGQSLVHASRLLTKTPLPERAATTDLFHDAANAAESQGLRFYFLGATKDRIDQAVEQIRHKYPALKIAGWRHGYFERRDEMDICAEIRRSQTDVLWVGLGVPRQEEFCIRNLESLRGVGWVKTCGGLFDHLQPDSRRAPIWMQSAGLEWLFRVWLEPRKYFWRYATTNGTALWLLATQTRGFANE